MQVVTDIAAFVLRTHRHVTLICIAPAHLHLVSEAELAYSLLNGCCAGPVKIQESEAHPGTLALCQKRAQFIWSADISVGVSETCVCSFCSDIFLVPQSTARGSKFMAVKPSQIGKAGKRVLNDKFFQKAKVYSSPKAALSSKPVLLICSHT